MRPSSSFCSPNWRFDELAILAIYYQLVHRHDRSLTFKFPPPANVAVAAFFASFRCQGAMWPVHTWLPERMSEARRQARHPGAALKNGHTVFCASAVRVPGSKSPVHALVYALSVGAIIYTSLVALVSRIEEADRYSSSPIWGSSRWLFTLTEQGVRGSVSDADHGIVSGACFSCVGSFRPTATREISRYGAWWSACPTPPSCS